MRGLLIVVAFVSTVGRADDALDAVTENSPAVAAPVDAAAPPSWAFAAGLGLTVEQRRDINPDVGGTRARPQLFAHVRYRAFAVLGEWADEPRVTTGSGGLGITTEGYVVAAWARYHFARIYGADAFATVGGGARFDRVETTFDGVTDTRDGSRRFGGGGVGVSRVAWRHLLWEAEARVFGQEAVRVTLFAGVLRLGLTF